MMNTKTDITLVKFFVAKSTEGVSTYGNVWGYDTSLPSEKVDIYDEKCEIDFSTLNFIDEINEYCGTVLDLGDYDFLDINQCALLKNWLEQKIEQNGTSYPINLFKSILNYTNQAIQYGIGLGIEC